ncbi:uncharacterized protein DUF3696 [Acinetobacter calcoaceticus]|uniref:Uncharacterized protein DUF3696 n=1 Tax=Acinetobacter calcoaceticus TaxID=471 RepID=A0A4R1XM03_ACICA|nr:uncharacterized protein DUF3696 [Acinetobacter calcoaceticus]
MSKLKSIRLKNLRSLKDTGDVELKPITILVGKNSVGKSTFLRTFPLLRQSCEKETRAPILWYGNLVDFGDFGTALNKKTMSIDGDDYIEFSFNMELDSLIYYYRYKSIDNLEPKKINTNISLRMREHNKSSYASQLKMDIFGNTIILDLNQNQEFEKISINEIVFNKDYFKERGCTYEIIQRKILPIPRLLKTIRIKEKKVEFLAESELFNDYLKENITRLCRKNTSSETIEHLIENIPWASGTDIYNYFCNQNIIIGLAKNISQKGIDSTIFKEILCFFYLGLFENLVRIHNDELSSIFSDVRYLEPLRATAQRYYRRQELAIDEIDSKGSNIAMFLDSLSAHERVSINKILKDDFDIELNVTKENGHLALTIKNSDLKEATNIADLGVGYSQILPFIIQLWSCIHRKKSTRNNFLGFRGRQSNNSLFVIEQPELHLHPAYQSKISDVICKINKDSRNYVNLIIETHSPHIIYRLGELIELGEIDKESIQVLVFEESENGTSIKKSIFDENGRLNNWPIGFFQP